MITPHQQWLTLLLITLIPTLAWGDDRRPMPPPTPSAHSNIVEQQKTTHAATTTISQSDKQVIAKVESSDVRAYTRQDGTKITEYTRQGRVYMIKVKPPGDLPAYYLYDEHGNGQFSRRLPGGYQHISPPQWVIKEF